MRAVVPMRAFARAKSRLAPALDAPERARLARAMFEHVLGALADAELETLVATDAAEVAEVARAHGAESLFDPPGAGLAAVVQRALDAISGPRLVIMADLPHLARADLDALAGAIGAAPVALAPDARERGTNALAFAGGGAVCLGREDSFAVHRATHPDAAIVRAPGLAYDVDEPSDLARLGREYRKRGSPTSSA